MYVATLSNVLKVRTDVFSCLRVVLCFPGADFRGAVRFGVVTNKQVAEAIPLQDDETVYLYRRLNSSLVSKSQQVMKVQMKGCFRKCEQILAVIWGVD